MLLFVNPIMGAPSYSLVGKGNMSPNFRLVPSSKGEFGSIILYPSNPLSSFVPYPPLLKSAPILDVIE